jgi:hexosaminidase
MSSFKRGMRPSTIKRRAACLGALLFAGQLFAGLLFTGPLFASSGELPLIPLPAQAQPRDGQLIIASNMTIQADPSDAAALRVAHALSRLLAASGGPSLSVATGETHSSGHVIQLSRRADAPVAQHEGYTLDVSPEQASIVARDEAGLYYGAVTLWQLFTAHQSGDKAIVPAVHIADWPHYAWRGLMIDSARHMQSVAEIRQILDQMALHKLNTLHWHLTDDQGWRIEIKRYPQLTGIGAWRTPPDAGKAGEPVRYGGYYSQADIRQLVAYAAARYITIVPELDMPGHAQAAVAAYPELGVTGTRPSVSTDWGVNPYLYNVDKPTLDALEEILDEVMALFPSRYIHLGGDEAIKDQWQASPAVQARMHALGLANAEQLQSWFMGQLGTYLGRHGRRLIGWDEILDGGVPGDAAVMSWRGSKGIEAALAARHDVVVAPDPYLYFDYVQSDRDDETAGRLPVQTLQSVYTFQIEPRELAPGQSQHILGAQANVWSEHMPSAAHLQHAIFPRLDALAEIVWTPTARRSWPGFLERLPAQLARYRQQGIGYADSAYAVDIRTDRQQALNTRKALVTLSNQSGSGTIRYTTDGTPASVGSTVYTGPFSVALPTTVNAATLDSSGATLATSRTRILDERQLRSIEGNELAACPSPNISETRTQPEPDATTLAPTYTINAFDSCRTTPALSLSGIHAIRFDMARLPNNVALAHDAPLVVSRPPRSAHGELELRVDRCDGPALATSPLPDPASSAARFELTTALPSLQGSHTLCFFVTAPAQAPFYGFARLQLQTAAVPTPAKTP